MLTITTTHQPATDLGYLLHKHPDRLQHFELGFGTAHIFYPEASEERCTAAMLLDIDPINLTSRGNRAHSTPPSLLQDYINDRPYTASSHLSVAISKVLGTALSGRCVDRPELVNKPIPLSVTIASVHSRFGTQLVHRLFDPLGYTIETDTPPMDPNFPQWGDSPYHNITLSSDSLTLSEVLVHLYVLLPALDNQKHYWINQDETDKLLRFGQGWLESHPAKDIITRRYLGHRRTLYERAAQEMETEQEEEDTQDPSGEDALQRPARSQTETDLERPVRLQELRTKAMIDQLHAADAHNIIDLGCGQGDLLAELIKEPHFTRITGLDVSLHSLERARRKLRIAKMTPEQQERITLLHGSLTYLDDRLKDADAAVATEVIEHLDASKLQAFQEAVLAYANPRTLIITTPNREYNTLFTTMETELRHRDHRFEWTRQEFKDWANAAAEDNGYQVSFAGIGPEDETLGHPTQMAVFHVQPDPSPSSQEAARG